MKIFLLPIVLLIVITLSSCQNDSYFEFDQIDYYSININQDQILELYDKQSNSTIDSLKMGIILDDLPKSIVDTNFILFMKKMGYEKQNIDASKYTVINKLFSEKKVSSSPISMCIYEYRDVLVFRKLGKIIGMAKICFGCSANQITGTSANTQNFGQHGGYEKLERILRPKNFSY